MNIIKWKNIYLGGHYVWCFSSYLKKFIFNKVKTLTPNYNLKSWIILTCNQSFHENIFYLIVNIPHCPKITLSFIIKTNQSKRGFVNMVVSSFLKLRSLTFYRAEILVYKIKERTQISHIWLLSTFPGDGNCQTWERTQLRFWDRTDLDLNPYSLKVAPQWLWASDLTSLCLFPCKFVVRITGNHAHMSKKHGA